MTPGNRVAHRLLARWQGSRASCQQRQPLLQLVQEGLGRKHLDEGRRQFNGQRQPIESMADLRHRRRICGGHREVRPDRLRPFDEEAHRVVLAQGLNRRQAGQVGHGKRRQRKLAFSVGMQRRPAGGQHLHTGCAGQKIRHDRGGIDDVLEVVEDQKEVLSGEHRCQSIGNPTPLLPHPEGHPRWQMGRGMRQPGCSGQRTRHRRETRRADPRRPATPGGSCPHHRVP